MAGGAGPQPMVVDASVALKWQLDDEEHVANALILRDDVLVRALKALYAPYLFVYEIINGVVSAVRQRRLDAVRGETALGNLLLAGVALRPPAPDRIFTFALELGVSAYDGAYIALAENIGGELWTADRQLYDAARPLTFVRWIGHYPLR